MKFRHLAQSSSRRALLMVSLMLTAGLQQPVQASGADVSKFRPIEPQYIAALGDAGATPAAARNPGFSGTRTRARALANWTTTRN